jgi:hypothetical protein
MDEKGERKKEKGGENLNWRSFLTATMLTALMLALTFIPMSGSQTAMPYDPWADINDDGKIDIKDIGYACRLFGTMGDPTKPVIISEYTWKLISQWIIIPAGTGGCINITTAGYRQITIYLCARTVVVHTLCLNCPPTPCPSMGNITVVTAFLADQKLTWMREYCLATVWMVGGWYTSAKDFLPRGYWARAEAVDTHPILAPTFCIAYYNQNNYNVTLRIEAYLTM